MKENTYLVLQSWMVTELGLQGTDLMVYATLYAYTIYGRGGYDGDMKHISEWTGLSERAIKYALGRLVDSELIVRAVPSKGRNRTLYKAVINHAKFADHGDATMQNVQVNRADIADQPCKICTPTITNIQDISKNKKDIYKNNNAHSAGTEMSVTPSKPSGRMLADEFEEAWKLYPRKEGKTNARKAYINARREGVERDTIINGLRAYVAHITREHIEQSYIKHGSTWFHQRCWEDDYGQCKTDDWLQPRGVRQDADLKRILYERQQARREAVTHVPTE